MAGDSAALAVLVILSNTWANGNGAYEGLDTTHTVNDGRTGKVMECGAEGVHHE